MVYGTGETVTEGQGTPTYVRRGGTVGPAGGPSPLRVPYPDVPTPVSVDAPGTTTRPLPHRLFVLRDFGSGPLSSAEDPRAPGPTIEDLRPPRDLGTKSFTPGTSCRRGPSDNPYDQDPRKTESSRSPPGR